ncbi:MAG: DUF418 domain-containing protein [Phycisphaerales bacterium]|nr:MAG: DUF418 domain-containing protein [Phycisphaerales bacterium]
MEQATPPHRRIPFLDVLRGVAMLGILPVNVPYFALPVAVADKGVDELRGGAALAAVVTDSLFSFRFITLFSFLFGVGVLLLKQRCDARGVSHAAVMVRRLGALALFGALHIVLLWSGDILLIYAVLGFVFFACVRWRVVTLGCAGALLVMIPILLTAALAAWPSWPTDGIASASGDMSEETVAKMTAAAHAPMNEFLHAVSSGELHPSFETAVYRDGTFTRQVIVRVATWLADLKFYGVIVVPRVAGLMLLGMACAKPGWVLRPVESRRAFRRAAAWGLGAGVPLQALCWLYLPDSETRLQYFGYTLLQIASLFMAAGYLGLVGMICARASGPPAWTRPLSAVGRTAFSNYILQSLMCTALFYSWGLGLFGRFDRASLWGVVAGVWAFQLAVSSVYARHFNMGPLETVWRRLTYGRAWR